MDREGLACELDRKHELTRTRAMRGEDWGVRIPSSVSRLTSVWFVRVCGRDPHELTERKRGTEVEKAHEGDGWL